MLAVKENGFDFENENVEKIQKIARIMESESGITVEARRKLSNSEPIESNSYKNLMSQMTFFVTPKMRQMSAKYSLYSKRNRDIEDAINFFFRLNGGSIPGNGGKSKVRYAQILGLKAAEFKKINHKFRELISFNKKTSNLPKEILLKKYLLNGYFITQIMILAADSRLFSIEEIKSSLNGQVKSEVYSKLKISKPRTSEGYKRINYGLELALKYREAKSV